MVRPNQLPDKLFFRIGEVAEIVGVRPHVLRYWEEEFGVLKPMKTRGAHRQYRRRDVELALVIKRLLYEEGFTVAGARKRLRDMGDEVRPKAAPVSASAVPAALRAGRGHEGRAHDGRGHDGPDGQLLELRAELVAVRAELAALLSKLDQEGRSETAAPVSRSLPGTTATSEIVLRIGTSWRER